jgi:hypothetical protein
MLDIRKARTRLAYITCNKHRIAAEFLSVIHDCSFDNMEHLVHDLDLFPIESGILSDVD